MSISLPWSHLKSVTGRAIAVHEMPPNIDSQDPEMKALTLCEEKPRAAYIMYFKVGMEIIDDVLSPAQYSQVEALKNDCQRKLARLQS